MRERLAFVVLCSVFAGALLCAKVRAGYVLYFSSDSKQEAEVVDAVKRDGYDIRATKPNRKYGVNDLPLFIGIMEHRHGKDDEEIGRISGTVTVGELTLLSDRTYRKTP